MKIRAGYEIAYQCPQPTPMIVTLSVFPERVPDLITADLIRWVPWVPANTYHDSYGNFCHVIQAPAGLLTISTDFVIHDDGRPDETPFGAEAFELGALPVEALLYLLASRYCETDRLMETAWKLFGAVPKGWPRVQAICDFVHNHIEFGYAYASPTKTAFDAFAEGRGVCRDFAHLAITFCRCMNIPARYCTGYLGDIGEPPDAAPMDFSGWFEAYLGGRWYTCDARHNRPRIGRILMARGRDATDVAMVTSFGPCTMSSFKVVTEEVR